MSDTTAEVDATYHAADRLLLRVGRQAGPWVVVLALTGLATAAAELALPTVLGRAVDAIVRDGDLGPWLMWASVLAAVLVAAAVLDDLAVGIATARSTAWLRRMLMRHVLALGPRATERFAAGDVTTRLIGNTADAGSVGPDVVRAVVNVFPAVGAAVALALIDPWLCVTLLAGMPVLLFIVRAFARDASEMASRYLNVQGKIAGRLVDALAGARTIAAAGTAKREANRVLEPLPELRRHGIGMWRMQMRITTQDAVLVSLLEVAVLAVAGAQLARGRISPGEMVAASQYVLLATTLTSVVSTLNQVTRGRAAAARVAEVLDEPPMVYGTASLPPGQGEIEFRGVTVGADGDRALDGLDLVVAPGSLVAIVGASGSGKSRLAALVGRLVDPDAGEVLLDGVPLRQLKRDELRRAVGYGFERPALLGETLADAIAFGASAPPSDDVVAAATAARADDFIRLMPDGYLTRLADAPMSGGEVQRIGLARTFAHAGRVVVLDDVAASLDTVTEHHISQALTGALADRTRIVVAHRASTAARAQLVVWLHGRRVRAVAPHGELWKEPEYRALFEADASPAAAPEASSRDGGYA
ncbi:MAG: ABC transporter ATP-binding protein/permease [Actinomycetota bacterium]|nr:ABC transporter ATP-binding protein/permease [Actinomycetota bacterium]